MLKRLGLIIVMVGRKPAADVTRGSGATRVAAGKLPRKGRVRRRARTCARGTHVADAAVSRAVDPGRGSSRFLAEI
jgi:hypothetical protein